MIFIHDGQRINIFAPVTLSDGTRYANLTNPDLRRSIGVIELPEPQPPEDYSEETYYRTETAYEPYVIYTRKSEEQLKQVRDARIKAEISVLESGQNRAIREAALTGDKSYLQSIENKIQALRAQL